MAESLALVRENNETLSFDEAIKTGVNAYGIVTSFDVETDEDKRRLFKAQNTAAPLSDMDGTYIDIVDIAFTTSSFISGDDETEKTDNPAVILIDQVGECYFSASLGVYESVKALINSYGMPKTWDHPIKVVTKTRSTRNGRTYRYLDM